MKNKKLTIEGEFANEPEIGRFSYAKTRYYVTEKLLSFERNGHKVFTEVCKFKIEDDGKFTVEVKFSVHVYQQQSDGTKKEEALKDLLLEIEGLYNIGKNWNPDELVSRQEEGILTVAYITDLSETDD